MTETISFPRQPDEVTPAWLTEQLQVAGAIGAHQRVARLSSVPLGEGVGMMGVLARVGLEYEGEPGAVSSVVVKCAAPSEANRAVAMSFRVYEREVNFFREIADLLEEGVPDCYAAEIDLDTGDFVLVLEDLVGYRQGDQVTGCDGAEAELCIDVMAGLHARWWHANDRPELAWVPRVAGDMHRTGMVAGFGAGWEPTLATFGDLLTPEVRDAGPRFLAALPNLHDRMGQEPQTLIHGDFRLDNLLFGVDDSQHPIGVLDWQGMLVSKGTHDVAYLLSQNVRTDERRAHERSLVQRYHARLTEGGVTGYSAEQCWEDYRLAALYLFEYAVVIAGTLDPANDRGTAFMGNLVERSAATITDLGLLDLL